MHRDPPPVAHVGAALFLTLFAAQAGFLVMGPLLPDIAADFGTTTAAAGQLRTVSAVAGGVTALVLMGVGRRVPLRPLLAAGLALIGFASLVSAAAPSFTVLALAQIAVGAGIAALLSGALAAAAEWVPPEARSRVLAWAIVGQPAAWVVGMPVIGAVADLGWRWAWLAAPFAASMLALAVLRVVARFPASTAPPVEPGGDPMPRSLTGLKGWAFGELLAYAGWSGTLVYAGALLLETYDASPGRAGLLLGASAAAYFPGTFLARRYVDRHSRHLLIGLGLALSAGVALFGLLRPSLWTSATLFAALVFIAGGRTLAGAVHGVTAAGADRIVVTSVRTAAAQFGNLLGVGIGGLALAAGGYGALGAALAGLFLLAVVPHVVTASNARHERRRLMAELRPQPQPS